MVCQLDSQGPGGVPLGFPFSSDVLGKPLGPSIPAVGGWGVRPRVYRLRTHLGAESQDTRAVA